MVNSRRLWQQVRSRLAEAGVPEPEADANLILELAMGDGWRWRDDEPNEKERTALERAIRYREERRPIQYLLGHWPFLDLELEVGPGVLVPRADTEVVCEAAARLVSEQAAPVILDLCAGSGALGLGLKRLVPGAQVTALEKSPEAWPYLMKNCRSALPMEKDRPAVTAREGDVFSFQQMLEPDSLDLIVSNPPYLTAQEMQELQPEVAFEPAMALAAGQDGLDFYRHISSAYFPAVRPGGWLVFEIGWQQKEAVTELLLKNGWTCTGSCKDYGGNDRAVWAQKPQRKNKMDTDTTDGCNSSRNRV